jgi:subtilisin-like proprotein convertase family protein
MDAGGKQWIVAILGLMVGFVAAAFAEPVHIYTLDCNLPIPNPDDARSKAGKGWMDDAIIEITDHFLIADLDVNISITHSDVFDLQLYLQGPTGPPLCLNMYDLTHFNGENYTQTIFDDEAELSIEQGQPPFTGRFKPQTGSLLSIFDGLDAYGPWRLRIYDARYYDTGILEHFELTICEKIPADLNGDGEVDFADYVELAGHLGDKTCVGPGWCEGADLNKSGSVDLDDLAQFFKHWLEGNK